MVCYGDYNESSNFSLKLNYLLLVHEYVYNFPTTTVMECKQYYTIYDN